MENNQAHQVNHQDIQNKYQILPEENQNQEHNQLLQENRCLKAQVESMRIERERADHEARNERQRAEKSLKILEMGHKIKVLEMTNQIQRLTFEIEKIKLTVEKTRAEEAITKNNNRNEKTTFLTKAEQLKWGVRTFFEGCNARERPDGDLFASYKEWYQFVADILKGYSTRACESRYLFVGMILFSIFYCGSFGGENCKSLLIP